MKKVIFTLLMLVFFAWSCAGPPEPVPEPVSPHATATLPEPPATEVLPEPETPPAAALPTLEDGSVLAPEEENQFSIGADDDSLVFWAKNLPPGATFDPETHTFSWTPQRGQAGIWPGVCFYVANEYGTDFECIRIIVYSANDPPVLKPVPLKVVEVGGLVTFTLQASDPDGDELVFSAQNLPPGAQFSPPSFAWVPKEAGVWPAIMFTVSDGELKATQRVIIGVVEAKE